MLNHLPISTQILAMPWVPWYFKTFFVAFADLLLIFLIDTFYTPQHCLHCLQINSWQIFALHPSFSYTARSPKPKNFHHNSTIQEHIVVMVGQFISTNPSCLSHLDFSQVSFPFDNKLRALLKIKLSWPNSCILYTLFDSRARLQWQQPQPPTQNIRTRILDLQTFEDAFDAQNPSPVGLLGPSQAQSHSISRLQPTFRWVLAVALSIILLLLHVVLQFLVN